MKPSRVWDMGKKQSRRIPLNQNPLMNCVLWGCMFTVQRKAKDSINNGIQWIQDLEIIVHPRCVNFLTEISNYMWKSDRFGKKLNEPIDDFNHLMDAMRYALEQYILGNGWIY